MKRPLAKFGLPFEKVTPLVHFPKPLNVRGITRVRLNMQFQQEWPKVKKITALSIFWRKTENSLNLALWCASRRDRQFFFVAALHAVCPWKAID